MKRKTFVKLTALSGLSLLTKSAMSISALKNFTENTEKMPVLFMGHGNPMNAIEDNVFTRGWKQMVTNIPTPKAILCISAHWETNGTKVLSSAQPRMIYDMYGFPQKLYQVKYPAAGSPELAKEVSTQVKFTNVALDDTWGFDHGTWSVLVHAFPNADIPCFQLSLNKTRDMKWHYNLAKELSFLRRKGVLIVGSGNIVHNLSNFKALFDKTPDWALEFDKKSTELVLDDNHSALLDYKQFGKSALLSVNSAEHYIPMLYAIAQKEKGDSIKFFNNDIHENLMATGMRSIRIG